MDNTKKKHTHFYDHEDRINDQARVLFFLIGAEGNSLIFNSHKAHEAFDAACRLVGRNPEKTRASLSAFGVEGGE